MSPDRYYFDYNATTPLDKRVLSAMVPILESGYGNASSIHSFGQESAALVEHSRKQIASLVSAEPSEIVFTSGGTEADNLAIFGVVQALDRSRKHIITSRIEHPAVLQACEALEKNGSEVTFVNVGSSGVIDPDAVRAAIRPETILISIMHSNNELGTEQPIAEIAAIAHEAGAVMHSDGVQSTGKISTDMKNLDLDLFSLSAHKIYGPKGVGALFIRKGTLIKKTQYGGHHERNHRPGTLNVPGIVGFGVAAELAEKNLHTEPIRLAALRDRLERGVLDRIDNVRVNGSRVARVSNTTNLCFDFVDGEAMVIALDLQGVAVSSGAACSSGAVQPSHVLMAIGLSPDEARSSIRFSLGKQNTEEEVDAVLVALSKVVVHLRNLSTVRPN